MTHWLALLPLTLLGAVLGLDVVSFPQAMVSRPIVAATLAGALVGAPLRGLICGVTLELFALETLPFGASRYPEWGSASVVGGAIFAVQDEATAGAMAISVFCALVTASIGGWSMIEHRKLLGRYAGGMREYLARGSSTAVTRLQLRGLTFDLLRGGLLTFVALAVFSPLSTVLFAGWTFSSEVSRGVSVALAGAVGAAAVWKVVHTTKGARWYLLGGFVIGAALVVAT
ncbi:MAG: PTS sugar transporter subunit IIC [Gemmatimonadetes bacterium]|nr:PTS sugar transporter subunit IIC [Gemmatimonadota bacterium]MBI3568382.1 PTS sugar transporter subunit IIC [Gemmatimonadota bacterium]